MKSKLNEKFEMLNTECNKINETRITKLKPTTRVVEPLAMVT